jgi:Holliday junction resolvasome RuvABC endonuclease subunit
MSHRIAGIDVSTRTIAIAILDNGKMRTLEVSLGDSPVRRLSRATELGYMWIGSTTVVVPEDPPMVKNSATHRALCEVLGAFLSGCEHAAWVHPGMPVNSWKKASVGRGNASKTEVDAWARATYRVPLSASQNVCDAIGIAHAGAAWWASREEAA